MSYNGEAFYKSQYEIASKNYKELWNLTCLLIQQAGGKVKINYRTLDTPNSYALKSYFDNYGSCQVFEIVKLN